MVKKITYPTLDFGNIDKHSLNKLDEMQDYKVGACYIKKITSKFWHKQRMRTSKFFAALYYLHKIKHPRFMQKATRKNLTRRKYGT